METDERIIANVYFVSGMSANCSVFDQIELPAGYAKKYIEWLMPNLDQSLDSYTHQMAESIDTSIPFVLIGYSFGGVIVQEMNKFLNPLKTIIIASIKHESEAPTLIKVGRKLNLVDHIPTSFFKPNDYLSDFFASYVYSANSSVVSKYVSYTDAVYTKWSLMQMINWKVTQPCPRLYHIHGSRDQMFPIKHIIPTHTIKGGDHLMVIKHPRKISKAIADILNCDSTV